MIRGIYTSASGMIAETTRTDTIANNLANVGTAGYKKDTAVTSEFGDMLLNRINDGPQSTIGRIGVGTAVAEIGVSHAVGAFRQTGNNLDLAIAGKGFFVIDTPGGERYTRNGTFMLNQQGELMTQEGMPVAGEGGVIRIPADTKEINSTGEGRIYADNTEVGRLRLVGVDDERLLRKEGNSLFRSEGADIGAFSGRVEQGCLEMSNSNVINEMVNLISAYRAYEVNAKLVQAHDQLMDKAANEVGKA